MADTDLVFLPWVRRGAAAGLLAPDTFGPNQPGLASSSATLTVNAGPSVSVPLTVMGPGHVTGLDRRQVVRTDPAPGSRSFEPNYFPLIELDEPSLPWLFTPSAAGAQARLRPWLCLVVVRMQDGVRLDPARLTPLPVLRIAGPARPAAELPDLADSWAWAHAPGHGRVQRHRSRRQACSRTRSARWLGSSAPACCNRTPTTSPASSPPSSWVARQGSVSPISPDDDAHLAPAWDLAAPAVELPVYYSWTFATGAGGDFQSLAMLLKARPLPPGIGVKNIDVSASGLAVAVPAGTTVPLAGALRPVGSSTGGWPGPDLQTSWETALRQVLNEPATVGATGDPLLAPPLYGGAQAGLIALDTGHPSRWFEQLNLSPASRAVAHLGTRVVQEQQDELMASAWAQAAELARVNQLLRQVQLGCRVAWSIHTRHIATMDPGVGLQVLAPAQARMTRTAAGAGLAARLVDTGLNTTAYSTALRRLARPRGAINRRVQRVAVSPSPLPRTTTVLFRLQPAQMQIMMARQLQLQPRLGRISLEAVAASLNPPRSNIFWSEATSDAVAGAPRQPNFAFVPMGTPVAMPGPVRSVFSRPVAALPINRPPGPPDPPDSPDPPDPPDPHPHPHPPPPVDSPAAQLFRTVAEPLLARFNPTRVIQAPPPMPTGTLSDAFAEALARTAPVASFAARARAVVTIPGPARSDETALAPVGLSPVFPQPMVQTLTDVAQELVLPSLDLVPPNTVVPLETNSSFVEAYMVGLNTEMGRELLWRGYPADLSATYFDRFWDATSSPGRPPDIDAIAGWGDRALGAGSGDEDFVMLVRSELLRRYPDAIIYATKAGEDRYPIFTGGFAPDVRYVGFDIGVARDRRLVDRDHGAPVRAALRRGGRYRHRDGRRTWLRPEPTPPRPRRSVRQMPVRITHARRRPARARLMPITVPDLGPCSPRAALAPRTGWPTRPSRSRCSRCGWRRASLPSTEGSSCASGSIRTRCTSTPTTRRWPRTR